jgi:hypothetical protein
VVVKEVQKFEVEGQCWIGYSSIKLTYFCIIENHVQFARAEAEFLWWLEQVELKHAEIEHVFNYYKKMVSVWEQLAKRVDDAVGPSAPPQERAKAAGQAVYARQTAHKVWAGLARRMDQQLEGLGISELRMRSDGKTLPEKIWAWRLKEVSNHFPDYE